MENESHPMFTYIQDYMLKFAKFQNNGFCIKRQGYRNESSSHKIKGSKKTEANSKWSSILCWSFFSTLY
jgi:hypothetical protein